MRQVTYDKRQGMNVIRYTLCATLRALRARSGQSLAEILIASAIGVIIVGGAVAILAPSLQGGKNAEERQTSVALGKELMENVRALAEGKWQYIDILAEGSDHHYWLNVASSPFALVVGDVVNPAEIVSVDTNGTAKNYVRYFYVETPSRTGGDIAVSGTDPDPSTRKVTVISGLQGGSMHTIQSYLTRSKNQFTSDSDWSGGAGVDFTTSTSNVNFTSSTSLRLNLPVVPF